ncbi:MAG TPA: penicillin-binding transpeptidase domain-containing protein [Bacillota bacterium]|nr:penicillin-binding transpeptidase domain-containing protein [Bacillota bacterium]
MKLLTRRAFGVLVLTLLLVFGLVFFAVEYAADASSWALHATNKHLYADGKLKIAGKIYDRNGAVLLQTSDGVQKYNENKAVRQAVMHAVGDSYGNIATGLQVVYGDWLSGWDPVNGAYRFNDSVYSVNSDMKLTLDSQLCTVAYNAMNGRKGAVGVYNYKTGEILCMVSTPTFDPANPPDVAANPNKYEGVYINRLLSTAYTPGSVFKLVTAAAAIDELPNINERVFHCDGKKVIGGITVTCPSPHGDVTFDEALAVSCNITFAEISQELGGNTLQKYADKAGFNSSLKVSGIRTATGKTNIADAEGGDLAWAGIGQYSDTANPLNFMSYVGAIANDGVRITPKLVASKGLAPGLFDGTQKKQVLSPATAERLKAMMRNNVIKNYGENNFKGLELCAKSGTAEVGQGKEPHSWFVGFLDREDYPLAFVVVIENGGSGSKAAGSVAAKVLKAAVK